MQVGQNEVESMLVDSVVQSRKLSIYCSFKTKITGEHCKSCMC